MMKGGELISVENFLRTTRDSGYKSTASSVAELIDNSFEAGAGRVDIRLLSSEGQIRLIVSDDGCGMSPTVLRLALQFGGSTRFNSRQATGRYGMGLPNCSLSRARRVDVYTWKKRSVVWWSYLDVDEISSAQAKLVPPPTRLSLSSLPHKISSESGTVVVWSKCDRLGGNSETNLVSKLRKDLGQIFREHIWQGKSININGQTLPSIDPLFLRKGHNLLGATLYGQPLRYDVRVGVGAEERLSPILVTFAELPIEQWHSYSNDEKRLHGISKRAGISIVRADREIDYGWFFMGNKRKENYDDWWRCEIRFMPELDELFGVTHTKQEIHPTHDLKRILRPDIERLAHTLNGRVRRRYLKVRSLEVHSLGQRLAAARDPLLQPLGRSSALMTRASRYHVKLSSDRPIKNRMLKGLAYRIEHKVLSEPSFFVPVPGPRELVVLLNEEHPFYERVYHRNGSSFAPNPKTMHCYLELLLFAAARAECTITSSEKLRWARTMREIWSKTLAAFLD